VTGLAVAARSATSSGPRLDIDLDAIGRNTRLLSDRSTGELMAVVKADGFGHGAVDVARTALAHGATRLGVTSLDEAWPLRDAGISAPLLSWLNPVDADFESATSRDIDVAVPTVAHLEAVAPVPGRTRIHLHIDAGMARDGAAPDTWAQLCRAARRSEHRGEVEVVGVMGHLGCADDPMDACNTMARTRFAWAIETARSVGLRPSQRHLAATAATLTDPRSHHTMTRVGAGLVGIDPSGTTRLSPAMTLTAPIVSVRRVRAGTPIGYGHTHLSSRPTQLALVPLGYADGLPRSASDRAEVQLRGRRHPVIGTISMDQLVIDLGDRAAEPGETVTVFGPGGDGEPTVADWATWADTIEHEIVTGIGARVRRRVRAVPHLRSLS